MNTKNTVLLVIILIVAVGAYFFLMSKDAVAPMPDKPKSVVENEARSSDYIGMTSADADTKAQTAGVMFRVVEEDGKSLPTTRDFQSGRINATVTNGIVTEYFVETDGSEATANETGGSIGMTTAEAKDYAKASGVDFRIVSIDGVSLPVTLDFRPGRISAVVENDIVIGYTVE